MAYGWRGDEAFVALSLPDGRKVLEVVAVDEHLYVGQMHIPNAYVDAPYDGDLLAGMEAIGAAQVGLTAPPPLAAAMTGRVDQFVESLRFGILGPLEIADMKRITLDSGQVFEVECNADKGTVVVTIDSNSRHLLSFSAAVGDPGHQVLAAGTFTELDASEVTAGLVFNPADRRAVDDFATLEASAYPLGQPAPDSTLTELSGGSVSLASVRGSVVVLDFWATWCVPCWNALPEIEALAEWAATSDAPVVVYSVSTLENTSGLDEQAAAVRRFLDDRELSVPTLLDDDDSFFAAMHMPGLPSTVLIAPDGTLARYHSGLLDDMFETLRAEALELSR